MNASSHAGQAASWLRGPVLATLLVVTAFAGADPALLVQLPLDEGSGVIAGDVSGMGNDGAINGNAAYSAVTGDGSAFSLDLDGADDWVDLGNIDVNGTGLTLAAWFNADSYPGPSSDPRLISKATGTASNDHIFMLGTIRSGGIRLRARVRVGGNTTTLIAGSGDLATGVWYHAAVTYNGAQLRLYLDGVEVGSTPLTGAVDTDPGVSVALGSQPNGANRFFNGRVDDARILQRALSVAELTTIVSGNQIPVAVDDGYAAVEDTVLSVPADGVLGNDTDGDGDPLQAVLENDVANGVLSLNADGSFDYTPAADFNGVDTFTYRANDGSVDSAPATVTLTVAAVNDAPVAAADAYQADPDTLLSVAAPGVLDNDTDVDLDTLQAQLVTDVTSGTLALAADGSFDYTPDPGFTGNDSFTYLANDGVDDSNTVTVTLTVLAPPTVVADGYGTPEDSPLVVPAATGVLDNDTDVNPPDDLTAAVVTPPGNGALTAFGADGSFTYVPAANFNGVDSFVYAATDGGNGASAQATVTLTVSAVNDAPVAVDDSYAGGVDTLIIIDAVAGVLGNDTDVDLDPLQTVLITDVANGTLNLNTDGSFDYLPDPGFTGDDTFTYQADDGLAQSSTTTVTISIGAGPAEPPRLVTGDVTFGEQIVDTTVDETHAVVAADFTGDGRADLVATDFVDHMVFWYENDGLGGYIPRVLDPDLLGAYPANVADVDLDGDVDVLAMGYLADTLAWYDNDGTGQFTRRDVDTAADGAHSVVAIDLDQDTDMDLVTTNQDSNQVQWYENLGNEVFAARVIDNTAMEAKRANAADIDGDGDLDVVAASFADNEIAWYENDGNENFVRRIIDSAAMGAYYVVPADVNDDGAVDLFTASQLDNTMAWYENDGAGNFTKTVIDDGAGGARSIEAFDIDGDGDVDAVGGAVESNAVRWYENDGTGVFTQHPVAAPDGAYGVFAIDADGDGDVDVLSAARDANAIAVHPQAQRHDISTAVGGVRVIDSLTLLAVDPDDSPAELTYTLLEVPLQGDVELDGVPLPQGGTFTQLDVDMDRVAYRHDGAGTTEDGFAFELADGGEHGGTPLTGSFRIRIGNPILVLPLDEGSGVVAGDISGAGNDGTLIGGPPFDPSSGDGSAFSVNLDGVDDYIDLGTVDAVGSGLTAAVWFNADSLPGGSAPRLVSKASGVSANDHIFMLSTIDSGGPTRLRARVRVGGTTTTLVAASGDLSPGEWRHAGLTYDGVWLRLYLDGLPVGSAALAGPVDTDPTMGVAAGSQPGGSSSHFDGRLDDVRLYARALSPVEMRQLAVPDLPSPIPTEPGNLAAVALSGMQTDLRWDASSDDFGVVGYRVFRDSALIATVAGTTYSDSGLAAGQSYDYEVIAFDADANESTAAQVTISTIDPSTGAWWDANWPYRVMLGTGAGGFTRQDRVVDAAVDFTQLFIGLGETGALDTSVFRCHEVDVNGAILTVDVLCDFEPDTDFNASTNARGKLIVYASGAFAPGTARYFHVYFDVTGGTGSPAPPATPLVTTVDDVVDESQFSVHVTTAAGEYFYQKDAGGFSSLLDTQGNDWIDFHPTGGSSGNFRGIPNLVYPEGHFHPGATTSITTLRHSGPLKTTLHSVTTDGLWEALWEIYPRRATMTVLAANAPYWFLYEGTPGGTLEPASDFVVRATGQTDLTSAIWDGDLPGDEWVYFADPALTRSLFLAHHERDSAHDSYRPLDGVMTVFGFGRENLISSIDQVPAHFTIGLFDDVDFVVLSTVIDGFVQPMNTALSTPTARP